MLFEEKKFSRLILESARKGDFEKLKQSIKEFNELNPDVKNPSRHLGESAFVSALDIKRYDIATYIVEEGLYKPYSDVHDCIVEEIESDDYAHRKPEDDEDPSELYSFLIAMGSDVNYRDFGGNTALDIAVKFHYDKAVAFLRKVGAEHSPAFEKTGELNTGMQR